MDFINWPCRLELRQNNERRELRGEFRYSETATMTLRGRVRKERFAPNAFKASIADINSPIDILVGHSFDAPLASRKAGTLEIESNADAVVFYATFPETANSPSWVLDAEKAIDAGLMTGLSPGFVVPPGGDRLDSETRTINEAILREFSLVTSPVYDDAAVELRSEAFNTPGQQPRAEMLWL